MSKNESKVPVVPVAISGTKDLWFRKRIRVVVGKRLLPEGQDPASLTEAAFKEITKLMPSYSEPPGRKPLRRQLTHLF